MHSGCRLFLMQLMNCNWGELSSKWPVSSLETISNYFVDAGGGKLLTWNTNMGSCLYAGYGRKTALEALQGSSRRTVLHKILPPSICQRWHIQLKLPFLSSQAQVPSDVRFLVGFWCIMESCSKKEGSQNLYFLLPNKTTASLFNTS